MKEGLELHRAEKDGLLVGTKSNNVQYTVREDRKRYFFPEEWQKFIATVKNKKHRLFYLTLLHTGGRIMEVLNLRHEDIDIERGTVTFIVVKQRKANKGFQAMGKSRSFFVGSNFISEYRSYIRGSKPVPSEYLFMNNAKLPEGYTKLTNQEKKMYFRSTATFYSRKLKKCVQEAGIEDYHNFSPHNLRKTYGMWMRTFDKEIAELCYRMGHDMDTYLAHYGSSLIFTQEERKLIQKIFGDVR